MPPPGEIKLLDANVWLALAFSDHAFHAKAVAWFNQQLDGSCAFCRVTQLALLRLLTNSKIMGLSVQSQKQAWKTFDSYLSDPRIIFLQEPTVLESEFRNATQSDHPLNQYWTDAYLSAFAISSNLTLATFDKGFDRFTGFKLEIIQP